MNRAYFEQIISKENKNNVDILKKMTSGILKPAMARLIESMTKGLADWEYLCIVRMDNEIYAAKNNVEYDARAILGADALRGMLGDRFCDNLRQDERLDLKKIDLNKLDLAAYCKLIRYRLIMGPLRNKVVLGNKNYLNHVLKLLDEVRQMRNMESHTSDEHISRYRKSQNLIRQIETIIQRTERAAAGAAVCLNNGAQAQQVLEDMKAQLEEFCGAVRLAFAKQPIKPDDEDEYTAEYLYGYDRVFLAYPNCEDAELTRFIAGELIPIMTLGMSKLVVDNGTIDFIEGLMHSKNTRQAEEAKAFAKLLDNDLKRIVSVIQLKRFENEPEPVHYTDLFVRALNHTMESICVLTDDEMLFERRRELPENVVVLRPAGKEKVTTKEPKRKELIGSESSSAGTAAARAVWKVIIPKEGSEVYYGNDLKIRYELKNVIGEGGEGSIYDTAIGRECFKIYHEDKLNAARQDKVLNMLAMKDVFAGSSICWPVEGIYESSSNHVLVGFSMPDVNVISKSQVLNLEELVISLQNGDSTFWNWNRIDLVNMAMTVVRNFKILHDQGVLVGDINPKNILVNREGEVYFIDTDSFQFGEFLCPVGIPEYSSPRLWEQECNYKAVKRTLQDELFAQARLLYYILFLGDAPYDFENNTIDAFALEECIVNKKYRFQKRSKARDENFIWGNLSPQIKECFTKVFGSEDGEDHPENYPTDVVWLNCLYEFAEMMEHGELSDELIPTDAIVEEGECWSSKVCSMCGGSFRAAHNSHEDMCPSCRAEKKLNRSIILKVKCHKCGKPFTVNLWDAVQVDHISDSDDFICPDCKDSEEFMGEGAMGQASVATAGGGQAISSDATGQGAGAPAQGGHRSESLAGVDLSALLENIINNYIKSDMGE